MLRLNDEVRFKGYKGRWYVIDKTTWRGKRYYLFESTIWGDEAPAIITDETGKVLLDDVYNGFDDLKEALDW